MRRSIWPRLAGYRHFSGPSGGPIVAAFLAGPIVFALGWLLHRFIVARVTGAGAAQTEGAGAYGQILTTLGISLILQNGGLIVFGSAPTGIRTPLSRSSWEIGDILLNQGRCVSFLVSAGLAVAVYLFLGHTRQGKGLRAAADNSQAALYMGIDVDRAHRVAWSLGVGITAVAGGLLAGSQSFQPYTGFDFVIVMYAGVVLGGLGSILGAFWGGLLIGDRAANVDLDPALSAAEHRDLRRLLADHLSAAARNVRPSERAHVTLSAHGQAPALGDSRLCRRDPRFDDPTAQRLFRAGADSGAAVGGDVARLEHPLRLQRLFLVRARRILGIGRLHRGARADPSRFVTVAHHPGGCDRRRVGRRLDRLSELPLARPLFRAGDARLPARDALRVPVARLSGNPAADEAGGPDPLYAVRRPARLCGAGTGPARDLLADLAAGSRIHVLACRCSRSSRTSRQPRPPVSTPGVGRCWR